VGDVDIFDRTAFLWGHSASFAPGLAGKVARLRQRRNLPKLKVLLCHNFYQQPGGEDQSFAAEASLLETHGHQVLRFTRHNDAIARMRRFEVARRTLWNPETFHELRELIRRERPEVMHCTNTFPLISPAAYYAARAEGVPIVQSLRNYRLFCVNAYFLRNGRVCEDCLGKGVPWPGVLHGCYRSSRIASAVVAGMLSLHRGLRTWARMVDRYFALTEFSRRKFIEGGLPARQVAVKPNFIHPDPGPGSGQGGYAAFIGRLSPEKGIKTLLSAWTQLAGRLPLKIIGDGPLADNVRAVAEKTAGIDWLGRRQPREVLELLGKAACLVMPSIWYEALPRTIIEAYAKGTPVVASRLGAMAELVHDGRTGLLFEPGNPVDLALKIHALLDDPERIIAMRRLSRREYEEKYTVETNYRMLMRIYEEAVAGSRLKVHG
jgi:glycosyltransferase involved in cell wall biosynthesis